MNLRDAKRELAAQATAGNAVLIISGSGIGKSQLVLQDFTTRKEQDEALGISWGLGTIFAATQTPPDLIGFQFKGEREYKMQVAEDAQGAPVFATQKVTITDPSVPLWMLSVPHGKDPGGKPAWMYDRFYLIIDEYGQGEADVKRAMAEIFLNGGTAPWYLPPGSIRVACSNEGTRYGVTKDFDFCIARRSLIKVQGNADIWVEDFANKPYYYQGRQWQTMPVIKAWALTNPTILFEQEPKEQGPWCHPRSLCALDRYLQVKSGFDINKVPTDPVTIEGASGIVGMPATQSIMQHLEYRLNLPPYETVVADPTGTEVPKKADYLMLMAYELAGRTQPQHLGACITYVQRLPKDMAITYITALLRRDYKGMISEPAMQGWIGKNAALLNVIASLTKN